MVCWPDVDDASLQIYDELEDGCVDKSLELDSNGLILSLF